jgi:hypothetical protein
VEIHRKYFLRIFFTGNSITETQKNLKVAIQECRESLKVATRFYHKQKSTAELILQVHFSPPSPLNSMPSFLLSSINNAGILVLSMHLGPGDLLLISLPSFLFSFFFLLTFYLGGTSHESSCGCWFLENQSANKPPI